MGLEELRKDYGDPLTAAEVAAFFGVDRRTVQKYPERFGGVWVAPGRLRFFENRIREILHANTIPNERRGEMAGRCEDQRGQGGNKDVRRRAGREKGSNSMGKRNPQTIPSGRDPYGLAGFLAVGQ